MKFSTYLIFVIFFRNPGHLQKNHPLYPIGKEKLNSNSLNRQLQENNRKNIDETQKSIPLNNEISLATNLTKEVRVLCWIMTNPKNHKTKAIHVKETWGQRCNILLFMSSESGKSNEIYNNIYMKISILDYLFFHVCLIQYQYFRCWAANHQA